MKISQELKALAIEQADRRCECSGENCRHHRAGSRCKRGLRGDQWKVFWRTEGGGIARENISAWCIECFGNNFEVPRETVALLAPDVVGYARLLEEDRRTAITLKSVLRDSAARAARQHRGRPVLERVDDDLLLEFPTSRDAVDAARTLRSGLRSIAQRLELPIPELCGAIHSGEVTRWRNGVLAGDAVEIAMCVRRLDLGRLVLTGPAVTPLQGQVELERITEHADTELSSVGELWALRL